MIFIRDKILKRQDKFLSDIFSKTSVSIFGCGGLGSNIAMMLARSGVGKINLFDFDKVNFSNLNRQNFFLDDLNKKKVFATKNLLKKIIPYVRVKAYDIRIDNENIDQFIDSADIFIEAFDDKESKVFLFDYFQKHLDKQLICASGVSGLGNLEDIKIKKFRNITMIGDFNSNPDMGLYAPYLMTVASIEALEALKIIRSKNE